MLRRRATWALCCALALLASAPASGADGDDEAVDVDAEEIDVDEGCIEQPLGWLARHGLTSYLVEAYPWITQRIVEESLVACDEDDPTQVEVSFEPHLSGPRWDRSWTLACERVGVLRWSCEFPEEATVVYLSDGDVGVQIAPDVSPTDALEVLATIVLESQGPGGIPDPFDASDPFLDLSVDSVLAVKRDEICAGLLVPIQLDPEAATNQFCVERQPCSAPSGACPWSVRVEGATE